MLASVLVALPTPTYAWGVTHGVPPAVASGWGQLLLVVAVAAHAWSLRPLCRNTIRAVGAAVAVLVVAVVLVGGLTSIVSSTYTRATADAQLGGLVSGLVAGLVLPFPVHLLVGLALRRHLRENWAATASARAGAARRLPQAIAGSKVTNARVSSPSTISAVATCTAAVTLVVVLPARAPASVRTVPSRA